MEQQQLMTAEEISVCVERMAEEITRNVEDSERLAIVGIRTAGVYLAQRLVAHLRASLGRPLRFGSLDITLYRDDLYSGLERPILGPTDITFAIDGLDVVLVDDVLFTGRTVRAAMDELMDLGRPRSIHLAVLLDRGHRELPVMANIIGKVVHTLKQERVKVHLREDPRFQEDEVILITDAAPSLPLLSTPMNERHS